MRRRKKKEIVFIITLFAAITLSLAFLFQPAYAKYRKQISGNTEFTIAQWKIVLNSEDINGKTTLENKISPTYDKNEYVNENVIAPGSTGYVDLIINSKEVDVTFNYSLTTSIPDESAVKDLKITHYQIDPEEATSTKVAYDSTKGPITGSITHNTETTVIRLYIVWDDSDTNIMDNAADTSVATNTENLAIIKTTINFTQQN